MTRQVLGMPDSGNAVTTIVFLDGSSFVVNWDGEYEVSGLYRSDPVTIYIPGGKIYLPWHRIQSVCHHDVKENE